MTQNKTLIKKIYDKVEIDDRFHKYLVIAEIDRLIIFFNARTKSFSQDAIIIELGNYQ